MGQLNKFFAHQPDWLGKTMVAGILACAIVPGSALATASYDASAFAFLSVETGATILDSSVDLDDPFTDKKGNADAFIDFDTVTATGGTTLHDVGVSGFANPTGGGSESVASVDSSTSITLLNESEVEQAVNITFDYFGDALTALDNLVTEAVGATVEILLGTTDFAGNDVSLVSELIELNEAGQAGVQDIFQTQLLLAPGAFFGIFADVNVDGLALSRREPPNGVPAPATLALLGIGFVGLLARKRRIIATTV
jgi:hypothetical protein